MIACPGFKVKHVAVLLFAQIGSPHSLYRKNEGILWIPHLEKLHHWFNLYFLPEPDQMLIRKLVLIPLPDLLTVLGLYVQMMDGSREFI